LIRCLHHLFLPFSFVHDSTRKAGRYAIHSAVSAIACFFEVE